MYALISNILVAYISKINFVLVVLGIGIAGACRREELTKMKLEDIKQEGTMLVITIPDSKNHTSRKFIIWKRSRHLYKIYIEIRSPTTSLYLLQ